MKNFCANAFLVETGWLMLPKPGTRDGLFFAVEPWPECWPNAAAGISNKRKRGSVFIRSRQFFRRPKRRFQKPEVSVKIYQKNAKRFRVQRFSLSCFYKNKLKFEL